MTRMRPELTILYRGPLSSCNYDCSYCPFAKRHETAAQLATDRTQLERFADWVAARNSTMAVFFTPWGEALTREWYRTAVEDLSHRPHIQRVAAQTNLSCDLDWLARCRSSRVGLWCTFHASQTSRSDFLKQCHVLRRLGIAHSVGMVAIPEDFDEIEVLRAELPDSTYLWLNAWDVGDGRKYRYTESELQRLSEIDPFFATNTVDHPSLDQACDCGTRVISVDGEGHVRRCHFVSNRVTNIYNSEFADALVDRPCPNKVCGCHIGYVHLQHLKQRDIYGEGILERIPVTFSSRR